MARSVAAKIDGEPLLLEKVRSLCNRWNASSPQPALIEWMAILQKPWSEIRPILLDDSENGRRLRQSNPFCGILSPQERWAIYREYSANETTGS